MSSCAWKNCPGILISKDWAGAAGAAPLLLDPTDLLLAGAFLAKRLGLEEPVVFLPALEPNPTFG